MRRLRRPNGSGFVPPDRCVFWRGQGCPTSDPTLYRVTAYPKDIPERANERPLWWAAKYEETLMCLTHRQLVEHTYGTAGPSQTYHVEWVLHTPHVWEAT
jgi:hypothetical protein